MWKSGWNLFVKQNHYYFLNNRQERHFLTLSLNFFFFVLFLFKTFFLNDHSAMDDVGDNGEEEEALEDVVNHKNLFGWKLHKVNKPWNVGLLLFFFPSRKQVCLLKKTLRFAFKKSTFYFFPLMCLCIDIADNPMLKCSFQCLLINW